MPVTECSRLTLRTGLNESQKTLAKQGLSHAKKLMETFTGNEFYILQEAEDPSRIYILGQWASVNEHVNVWIPSEENQGLLKELSPWVDVDYLIHFDLSFGSIPPSEISMFSLGRHVMETKQRPGFEETFQNHRSGLEAHALGPISGGWRMDKEPGREEFILFVPWKDIDQHVAFAKTEEFRAYAKIKDYLLLDATEIRHVSIMEFSPPRA